tara:strand:- start:1839 stop:1976 length:138 start_codon:yes stop_codon:yes gene_type:complete
MPFQCILDGGEIGSTDAVKATGATGMIPPISGQTLTAEDNFALAA